MISDPTIVGNNVAFSLASSTITSSIFAPASSNFLQKLLYASFTLLSRFSVNGSFNLPIIRFLIFKGFDIFLLLL